LSLIDQRGYTQAQRPVAMPSFLDIGRDGRTYRYELVAANLRETYRSARLPVVEHTHAVYHLVLYVEGRGFFSLEGQRHPVEQGVLAVVPPGRPHAFTPPGGHVVYHALTFALKDGERSLDESAELLLAHYTGRKVVLPALIRPDAASLALLRQRLEDLVHALLKSPVDWIEHQQRMISILGQVGTMGQSGTAAASLGDRAKALLDARFSDPALSLKSLAGELHTSPEHLCRQFRRQTGTGPMQYRNRLRMQAAGALLRNTNLPCKAIADRLGFSDLYTFSRAYRRAAGHSPVQERAG
jgi:AraC-like DNA-binding protein/mannose-6-phosphate isomerase-like protein (cupin superfamily)